MFNKKKPTEFEKIVQEILDLHYLKQSDYGRVGDPFANVRASEEFGIKSWIGTAIRMNDKMRRIQAAARGQNLKNESIEDSFLDIAVYAIIGLCLLRESND
jgi:hypothetical protein